MITIRHANERGHTKTDWLFGQHSFSFGEYYDAKHMGFGHLRVINEDIVQPNKGFATHRHNDMEIVTYIVSGALEHKDSMGTGSIIKPGEIQRMSAGTGVFHSEFNASPTELVQLLQIWILPEKTGLAPGYEQKVIDKKSNQLILIGSQDGRENSVTIHQDVNLYAAYLTKDSSINYSINTHRQIWIQIIKGKITVNNNSLIAGDGAAVTAEKHLEITCQQDAELLLFDLQVL
jgi:redox-sensitive bicupin YhaK (pirin superfamily)